MIIIEPIGGLANRMRVIASALKLQKELNTESICIWNENPELNASFHLLFEDIEGLKIVTKPRKYYWLKSSNQKYLQKKLLAKIKNKFAGIDYCIKQQDFKEFFWTKKTDIIKLCRSNSNLYIQTCEEFGDNYAEFQRFIPLEELKEKIRINVEKFNRTIGIHIRRTDNIEAVDNSPVELFCDKIDTEISKNNNVTFFLSTDDQITENELINKYKEKIITNKKTLDRNTVSGIQDAVIDMFCLSKTAYIYGSYWTSFGDISSRIGRIDFITLKK